MQAIAPAQQLPATKKSNAGLIALGVIGGVLFLSASLGGASYLATTENTRPCAPVANPQLDKLHVALPQGATVCSFTAGKEFGRDRYRATVRMQPRPLLCTISFQALGCTPTLRAQLDFEKAMEAEGWERVADKSNSVDLQRKGTFVHTLLLESRGEVFADLDVDVTAE